MSCVDHVTAFIVGVILERDSAFHHLDECFKLQWTKKKKTQKIETVANQHNQAHFSCPILYPLRGSEFT